jgi:hypothetical protein
MGRAPRLLGLLMVMRRPILHAAWAMHLHLPHLSPPSRSPHGHIARPPRTHVRPRGPLQRHISRLLALVLLFLYACSRRAFHNCWRLSISITGCIPSRLPRLAAEHLEHRLQVDHNRGDVVAVVALKVLPAEDGLACERTQSHHHSHRASVAQLQRHVITTATAPPSVAASAVSLVRPNEKSRVECDRLVHGSRV